MKKARPRIDERSHELAAMCKALAHPARVAILELLIERNTCICGDIVDVLPLAQSTVSEHLRVLKEAGFIRGEIDGPRVCYCINHDALRAFRAHISSLGA
jgi:ArsR family transcriptional regulator, arsenate/arsenite/antimonite-responsive transcriptional repressor